MRWKWQEATSRWLLGSYCNHTEPMIPEHERAYCITSKHIAYTHIETAIRNESSFELYQN